MAMVMSRLMCPRCGYSAVVLIQPRPNRGPDEPIAENYDPQFMCPTDRLVMQVKEAW